MRGAHLVLLGGAFVLLLPATAHASGEEGELATFFWSWLNLLLLLGVLVYFARKPILQYLRDRKEGIERNLEESADLLQQAEQRLQQWRTRAQELDAEVDRIQQAARKRAEVERQRILAEARQAAERIRLDAEAAIDQEMRRAREQLREEATDLAIELAAGLIRENLSESDQQRLTDEFVERIEPNDGSGAGG